MTYKKTEKEIIKAIVQYDGKAKSLAEVFNKSKLLEKRGIGIVQYGGNNIIFLDKDRYEDWEGTDGMGYVAELLSLIDTLIKQKYLVMIPFCTDDTLVIGAEESKWSRPDFIEVNGVEQICVAERYEIWLDAKGEPKYWPHVFLDRELPIGNTLNIAFAVSQELRELVKHHFKSEEEVRFRKQQITTWVSIFLAFVIGLASILVAIVK